MATDLTDLGTTMVISVKGTATKTLTVVVPQSVLTLEETATFNLAATGALKADQRIVLRGTLTDSQTVELDIYGVTVNEFTTVANFKNLKGLAIRNSSDELTPATAAAIKIEPGTHPVTNMITVPSLPAGATVAVLAPIAGGFATVTATTADDIKITNLSSDAAQYDLILWGESN